MEFPPVFPKLDKLVDRKLGSVNFTSREESVSEQYQYGER